MRKEYAMDKFTQDVLVQLRDAGFDCAVAIATKAEVAAGAACGQLSIITG
jgi:hypothetical protein